MNKELQLKTINDKFWEYLNHFKFNFFKVLSNIHVICAVIDKITHCANRIQWEQQSSFISFDEAVLQVITQSDFLSWDLQNFIYIFIYHI